MGAFEPRMGPEHYKTFSIHVPADDWRPATCEEIDCPDFLKGWQVRVEGLPPKLLHAAQKSGRRYRVLPVAANETWLIFEAGQPCFQASEHRIRKHEKPELYLVREGDHRGNPRGTRPRQHLRPEFWQEHFAEHQQGLADAFQEG